MRTVNDPARRLGRARVKLALIAVGGAAVGVLAVAALTAEDRPLPRGVSADSVAHLDRDPLQVESPSLVHAPQPAPVASASATQAPATPSPPAPADLAAVLAPTTRHPDAALAAWVRDASLPPNVRYGALRRLETERPDEAVSAAIEVLEDTTALVRLNAIAVLARSQDPRAGAALARVDARSQRLAQNLLARR